MGFGVVLRDLLSAADYCALADAGPQREELLKWLSATAPRIRAIAEQSGRRKLAGHLMRLESASRAAESNPALVNRLGPLVQAAFAAHDPPGLQARVGDASTPVYPTQQLPPEATAEAG